MAGKARPGSFALLGLPEKKPGELWQCARPGGGLSPRRWWHRVPSSGSRSGMREGFAAISIAVEGQTNQREPREPSSGFGTSGPGRRGRGFTLIVHLPLKEQWMYHSVADTILAHSLLRSLPEVDPR